METIIQNNLGCLGQGIRLLEGIDASLYDRPCPLCFNSCIGGHIRHNIDHYLSFTGGFKRGRIDYDDRKRDPGMESDPGVAAAMMRKIAARLEMVEGKDFGRPLQVKMDTGCPDPSHAWSLSTVRRELQFLLSHTVHHYALIATISRLHGFEPPADFGVAPSTLHFQLSQCAL